MLHDFMMGSAAPACPPGGYDDDPAVMPPSLFDCCDPKRSAQMRLAIELAVAGVFGVDNRCIEKPTRGVARVALARQVAMYLAHVGCGLSMTAAGRLFGRDRTTVAHACLIVEDRRDDPMFDRALDLLEWAVPVMVLRPDPFLKDH
jgi:Bacterial dnaA protein helix-turn-helix